MLFPNVYIRLFVLIRLGGWLLAVASFGWTTWRESREHKPLRPLAEWVGMLIGAFFSWPFVLPLSLWLYLLGGLHRPLSERARNSRFPWPWWVSGSTVLILSVLIGLFVASVSVSLRGR